MLTHVRASALRSKNLLEKLINNMGLFFFNHAKRAFLAFWA